jgi:hypothetical protein
MGSRQLARALSLAVSAHACVGAFEAPTEVIDDGGVTAPPRDASASPRDAGLTTAPRDAGPPPRAPYPGVPGVSPTLGGCPVFPPDDPWNRDISGAPVHPDSAAIIANIQAHGDTELRADFGSSADFGIPITVAPATQPAVPVSMTKYPDESDPGPFPIPANARIEGGGDDHVLVVQSGTCALIELYRARLEGGRWSAGCAARFDLRTNTARPQGWTSADQAGLPIAPGLARYEEVSAGEIRHALRVTFEHTRAGWVFPATHPGGESDPRAPAMGMRLRLRADYDIRGLRGQARVIATALKRYGMFVADTGTNWFLSGATDRRWADQDLAQLREVSGTAFEVVNTGPVITR